MNESDTCTVERCISDKFFFLSAQQFLAIRQTVTQKFRICYE